MIDTHAHIYNEYYDDIEKYITEAKEAGVNKLIASGTDFETSKEVIKLSEKYDDFYVTIGVHPGEDDTTDWIENLVTNRKVIAIGEIGLDFYYEHNKEEQIDKFKKCLDIAKKYNLPIVVHSREANEYVIDILKEYDLKGVIHSFSGTVDEAKTFIDMGYLIGINGICTFKNGENIREVIRNIDINNIILETDSPYLSPEPNRGKTNSSKNIPFIAKKIAEIKNISDNEVADITTSNVLLIFDKIV